MSEQLMIQCLELFGGFLTHRERLESLLPSGWRAASPTYTPPRSDPPLTYRHELTFQHMQPQLRSQAVRLTAGKESITHLIGYNDFTSPA